MVDVGPDAAIVGAVTKAGVYPHLGIRGSACSRSNLYQPAARVSVEGVAKERTRSVPTTSKGATREPGSVGPHFCGLRLKLISSRKINLEFVSNEMMRQFSGLFVPFGG